MQLQEPQNGYSIDHINTTLHYLSIAFPSFSWTVSEIRWLIMWPC